MGIDIQTLIAPLMALWLPFFRIAAFFHFCPLFDQKAFPRKIRIGLSLALAVLMTPMLPHNIVLNDLVSIRSLILITEQIIWGFVFGMMLHLVFVALQTAGHILSFNMGLGMAIMNDPSNGASTTVISQLVFVLSALLFFTMDGHLLFVTILYKGFTYWPIGQAINEPSIRALVFSLGWTISSALLLAIPTVFIMMIVQGSFGLLNRISPTLNLYSLGFPISMMFGLFCLMLLTANIPDHYLKLTNEILALLDTLWGENVQ